MYALMKQGVMRSGGYSRGAGGRRDDLGGMYVRSAWEANYARYLNWLQKHGQVASWAYEERTFDFPAIKRGQRSYTPDFRVTYADGRIEWHEVKGWMDDKSRVKLARMAKFYPGEVVRVIGAEFFREAVKKWRGLIPNWEGHR